MNKDVKAKWVAALRSGEYKQGQGRLKYGDKFCCLGVLCDLHDPLLWSNDDDPLYMGRGAVLPGEVYVWAGLPGDCPSAGGTSLVDLNDRFGRTFLEIADIIEKEL